MAGGGVSAEVSLGPLAALAETALNRSSLTPCAGSTAEAVTEHLATRGSLCHICHNKTDDEMA